MLNYDTKVRTRTKTVKETTQHTDYIDWEYEFEAPCSPRPEEEIKRQKKRLRFVENHLDCDDLVASNYGGTFPIWHEVLAIGMVSDWPYWEPRPSVLVSTHMGSKWIDWSSLTGVKAGEDRL